MKKLMLVIAVATVSLNAMADGMKVKLGGYCPVAYVGAKKALYGNAEFASEYEGSTYYFINKDAKAVFDKEPTKFVSAIQYDSWCATAMAMGKKLASDPKIFSIVDGKVYFFSSEKAKEMFDKEASSFIAKADSVWKKAGGNADKIAAAK